MNIIFMGTPEFAKESLKKIYESKRHNILAVITNADKAKGRSKKIMPSPVKEYALKNNIPIMQPEKVTENPEFIYTIKNMKPDLIVVVAYGKILPKELIDIPIKGSINLHRFFAS